MIKLSLQVNYIIAYYKNQHGGIFMSFNMYVPTRILFGIGQLNELHKQALPGKKAMIVISNGKSTRVNRYLNRVEQQLKLAGVESVVFDKVQTNPLKETDMDGAAFAKENSCDFVLGLGGGSVIDSAKAMAVMPTAICGIAMATMAVWRLVWIVW